MTLNNTGIPMKTTARLMLIACLALPFVVACKKEEKQAAQVEAPLTAPTSPDDETGWQKYVSEVVKRKVQNEGLAQNPYVYYLPNETSPDFQGFYDRQLTAATEAVSRGIVEGNLVGFASPASAKMADLTIAAFAKVPPNTMKGVKVLFIGQAADSERVKAAITPTGADFSFIEAK